MTCRAKCRVCERRRNCETWNGLCQDCDNDWMAAEMTGMDRFEWAARRARAFERKRNKQCRIKS